MTIVRQLNRRNVTMKTAFVFCSGVLLIFCLGYIVGGSRVAHVALSEERVRGLETIARIASNSIDVGSKGQKVVSNVSAVDKSRISSLRALALLRDSHPDAIRIPILTRRDKIEDAFAVLLDLSGADVETLNAVLQQARNKLNTFSTENARVSASDDGTITIAVPPFEGGAVVYDELMDSFGRILGEEQSNAFKKLLGQELADAFHNFGAEHRTLTIASTLPGYVDWKDGGLYAKDERQTSTEKLETIAHRFWANRTEHLLPHLKWIDPLIGDQLRKKATSRP
jgi:hypothetical protein